MLLANKVAVVTGGSRGIGRAIAEAFCDEGAAVMLVALADDAIGQAERALADRGCRVAACPGDVSDPGFACQVLDATHGAFGKVDILVNCAGIITRTSAGDLTIEEWRKVLDVNLNGAFYLIQKVLPDMVSRSAGKIINVTSQMARLPHPSASPSYEVSKAGLAALTRHIAYHYAKHGICVNSIAPGSIDTDLPKSMSAEARQRLKNGIPLGRLGDPAEVGSLAVFLASNQSDYITGATFSINGGSLMDV